MLQNLEILEITVFVELKTLERLSIPENLFVCPFKPGRLKWNWMFALAAFCSNIRWIEMSNRSKRRVKPSRRLLPCTNWQLKGHDRTQKVVWQT